MVQGSGLVGIMHPAMAASCSCSRVPSSFLDERPGLWKISLSLQPSSWVEGPIRDQYPGEKIKRQKQPAKTRGRQTSVGPFCFKNTFSIAKSIQISLGVPRWGSRARKGSPHLRASILAQRVSRFRCVFLRGSGIVVAELAMAEGK